MSTLIGVLAGCGDESGSPTTASGGVGALPPTGGANTTGGLGTGGVGAMPTGGMGAVATGGAMPTGGVGATATGGVATGGVGAAATGGVGAAPAGGAVPTGGVGAAATGGGGAATGGTGAVATGGAGAVGGGETGGAPTGGAGSLTLVEPIDRGGSYVLEIEGASYFEVSPAGARIIAFGTSSTTNIIAEGSGDNMGSTLWTSPQSMWDWPPPSFFDTDNFTATVNGDVLEMVGPAGTVGGATLHLAKTFTPDLTDGSIDIAYTIEVTSGSETVAPWEVSRVASGGVTFWSGTVDDALTQNGATYTASGGYVWFDQATDGTTDGKLFGDSVGGWVAHTDGTYLFLKQWDDVDAADQVTGEGEVEVYNGAGYVEVENQGPEATIASGASTTWLVRWTVVPLGFTTTGVGDAQLTGLVDTLLI